MPTIEVFEVDEDGTAVSLSGGPVVDTAATAAAYEAGHDISALAMAATIDLVTKRYMVEIIGEQGANYIANAVATGVRCSIDCTGYTEYT